MKHGAEANDQRLLRHAGGAKDLGGALPELRILERRHAQVARHRELRRQLEHALRRQLSPRRSGRGARARAPSRDGRRRSSGCPEPRVAPAASASSYRPATRCARTRAGDERAHRRIERADAHGALEMPERRVAVTEDSFDLPGAELHHQQVRAQAQRALDRALRLVVAKPQHAKAQGAVAERCRAPRRRRPGRSGRRLVPASASSA